MTVAARGLFSRRDITNNYDFECRELSFWLTSFSLVPKLWLLTLIPLKVQLTEIDGHDRWEKRRKKTTLRREISLLVCVIDDHFDSRFDLSDDQRPGMDFLLDMQLAMIRHLTN
jgi:hypothetical protein